jgi:hypothetical protein
MENKYFLAFICFLIFSDTFSQSLDPAYRFEQISDIDFGINGEGLLMQADYHHVHRLNPENNFRMGYGLAFMRYRSFEDINYTTKEGEQYLDLGLDSLQVENPAISSLNLFILLNYAPNDRIDFGLSIDVVGIGWGKPQDALLASGPNDNAPRGAVSEPVRFNSSVFASGSWRSQFHLRYWLAQRWALHTGVTYWLSAYQVTEDLGLEEDVFTQTTFLWRLGFSFRWGQHTFKQ